MSGSTSSVGPASATGGGWPAWKLALLFYPAVAAAVWINLFMLSLLGGWLGLPRLTPLQAGGAALPLGIPAAWLAGRWIRGLIDKANGRD